MTAARRVLEQKLKILFEKIEMSVQVTAVRACCLTSIDGIHCYMDWRKATDGKESGIYKAHVLVTSQDPRVTRTALEVECEVCVSILPVFPDLRSVKDQIRPHFRISFDPPLFSKIYSVKTIETIDL